MALLHQSNIPDPDSFYEELIANQRELSEEDSLLFQARLLLILANHIGNRRVLTEAMIVAKRGLAAS